MENFVLCRLVSLKTKDAKSFFRDERDLSVAIKYMKQNGMGL